MFFYSGSGTTSNTGSSASPSLAIIVGAVVGSVLLVGLVVVATLIALRRRRSQDASLANLEFDDCLYSTESQIQTEAIALQC